MATRRIEDVQRQLGANVRRVRLKRDLTQAQLFEMSRVEPRSLQRVEAGLTCSMATVVLLADALGVSVSSLFRTARVPERKPGRPKATVIEAIDAHRELGFKKRTRSAE